MDAIMTPVYKGTIYQYHVCSECGGNVEIAPSVLSGLHFRDTSRIKFCPLCGNPIIRFSDKPEFIKLVDYSPLDPFVQLRREYDEKMEWLFFCAMPIEQRAKIRDIIDFAITLRSGWTFEAAKLVREISFRNPSRHHLRKLEHKFGTKED